MRTHPRLRALAIALVGVLSAGLLALGVPAAAGAASTASISGTVTVPAGTVIGGYDVYVDVYNATTSNYVTTTNAASDGTYALTGLAAGSYKVRFGGESLGLIATWWKNAASMSTATAIAVADGEAKTGIDATFVKGGTISGTVAVPSGVSKNQIYVNAVSTDRDGTYYYGSVDPSTGAYSVKGLPAGSFKVRFGDYDSATVEQWWNNRPTYDKAHTITLSTGGSKTGVNAKLVKAAKISGTVSLPAGVTRTSTTYVYATLYSATKETYVTGVSVAKNGTYSLTGIPAGTYKVQFGVSGANALPQWWKGKSTWSSATKIALKAGQVKTGVSAKLAKGGIISGKVSIASGTGTKLSDVAVEVYRSDKRVYAGWAKVSSKGTYSLNQLPTGSYKVLFTPAAGKAAPQWASAKFDWSKATKIKVTAGKTKSGVNAALKAGGSIAGKVSGSAGKKDGAVVYAYRAAGDGEFEYGGWGRTTASGTYRIDGLAPGKYTVQFARSGAAGSASLTAPQPGTAASLAPVEVIAPTSAAPTVWEKWWKEKPDAESANRITVAAKKTVTGISTNLDKKAAIQKLKAATPTISGTAKVGKKLTAKAGTWTRYATLSYQWYANGKAIAKATKSSFTLTSAQKGKKITVKVTGKKTGYASTSRTSKPTAKVG